MLAVSRSSISSLTCDTGSGESAVDGYGHASGSSSDERAGGSLK